MNTLRKEDGQVTVLAAVFIVVLLGMAGFVLDVGSWFRQQRAVQTTVDSAALAGAQALPGDPVNANALATNFAGKNGGVAGHDVTISTKWKPNDMITVTQTQSAAGFFSKLFGVNTVNARREGQRDHRVPAAARWVAPIVVNIKHPDLSGPGCPCFNSPTTLPLGKTGAPGAFTLIDLDNTDTTGTVGASTLADWIVKGYDKYLAARPVLLRPGREVEQQLDPGCDAGALRHRPALPGLRHPDRPGIERRVPRHRLGRFHLTDAAGERHRRHPLRLLHPA